MTLISQVSSSSSSGASGPPPGPAIPALEKNRSIGPFWSSAVVMSATRSASRPTSVPTASAPISSATALAPPVTTTCFPASSMPVSLWPRGGLGVPQADAGGNDERAAQRYLEQAGAQRDGEKPLADQGDRDELDRHDEAGDHQCAVHIGDDERQRMKDTAGCVHRPGDHAAHHR